MMLSRLWRNPRVICSAVRSLPIATRLIVVSGFHSRFIYMQRHGFANLTACKGSPPCVSLMKSRVSLSARWCAVAVCGVSQKLLGR